jgi:hypothetical protein
MLSPGASASLAGIYGNMLKTNPIATHLVQGAAITSLGDTASQCFEGELRHWQFPAVLCSTLHAKKSDHVFLRSETGEGAIEM